MKISVTLDDLKVGVINAPSGDPLALAIQRAIPKAKDVRVGAKLVHYLMGEKWLVSALPLTAIDFLHRLAYTDRFEMLEWKSVQKGKEKIEFTVPFTFILPEGVEA